MSSGGVCLSLYYCSPKMWSYIILWRKGPQKTKALGPSESRESETARGDRWPLGLQTEVVSVPLYGAACAVFCTSPSPQTLSLNLPWTKGRGRESRNGLPKRRGGSWAGNEREGWPAGLWAPLKERCPSEWGGAGTCALGNQRTRCAHRTHELDVPGGTTLGYIAL